MLTLPTLTATDFLPLWPALILTAGACLVLLSEVFLSSASRSFQPVLTVIADRLPVSIFYGLATAFFTYVICFPLGILKAIKHRTPVDNLTSALIFIGYAIPGFALGAVLYGIVADRSDRAADREMRKRRQPQVGQLVENADDSPATSFASIVD